MALLDEPEVLQGERAFAKAQSLLGANRAATTRYPVVTTGWYGTDAGSLPEFALRGSFAMVDQNGILSDLVGDIIRLRTGNLMVVAYVLSAYTAPFPLMVTRRVFQALDYLSKASITANVEVLR